jgi:hypothetical protein
MKNMFKLSSIEFIELISGYNQIKEHTLIINYLDEITGSIEDFERMSEKLTKDKPEATVIIKLNKAIFNLKEESYHAYSRVEIKKYFKKHTNNYNKEDLELLLFDMDVFENMELHEIMTNITHAKYLKNKWDIPTAKYFNLSGKETEWFDYKKMRERVFPFLASDFYWIKRFLKEKLDGTTEQVETNKINIKNLHNNIFKANAFEVWQSMFNSFKITKSNRTDIDFMFQVMKYNGLIYNNIRYVDIQEWIDKVYQITFDKIKYTNHKTNSNAKRLIVYNQITSK